MIAWIQGQVIAVEEEAIVVLVGGVGFRLHVTEPSAYRIGEEARLHTHLHVRENELSLYGFADEESRALFLLLLGVSRVGPKAALSLLRTLSPETLRGAILNRQAAVLARAPGIGKKAAEAIILHLHDRLGKLGPGTAAMADETEVLDALTALGFSVVEAQRAVQQLPRGKELPLEEKIRLALAALGR